MKTLRATPIQQFSRASLVIVLGLLAMPTGSEPQRGADTGTSAGAAATSADKAVIDEHGRIRLKSSGNSATRRKKCGEPDANEDCEVVVGRPFERNGLTDRIRFSHPLECRI